eukprot:sb/3462151/
MLLWLTTALILLHSTTGSGSNTGCVLNSWGLPISGRSLSVPAIIPINLTDSGHFYHQGVQLAEVVLYTISHINRNILNGTGYCLNTTIIDSQGVQRVTVGHALRTVQRFTDQGPNGTCSSPLEGIGDSEQVVGFLGAAITDNSIAVANLCNVLQLPQVSYASTSTELDDREAYPYFLRTVPSDRLQAKAMVEVISKSPEWKYIGVIVSDTSYGSAGLSALLTETSKLDTNLCIGFQYKLENPVQVAKQVVDYVNKTRVSVIVLFSDPTQTNSYFSALKEERRALLGSGTLQDSELWYRIANVVYIGSDSWSTDPQLFIQYHGLVFSHFIGVTVYTKEISGFKEHLATLNRTHYNDIYKATGTGPNSDFFQIWWDKIAGEGQDFSNVKMDDHSSTTADATLTAGIGLRDYLRDHPEQEGPIDTDLLHKYLRNVSFKSLTGNDISFGRGSDGRYYIVEYRNKTFTEAGQYIDGALEYKNRYRLTASHCSRDCPPGKKRKPTGPCCHECDECPDHHVSANGMECEICGATMTHNANRTACVPVVPDYLTYTCVFAIALYVLVGVGVASAVGITVLFVIKFNSPVVQGHGVFVYMTLLCTCVTLLSSTPLYLGPLDSLICNLKVSVPVLGLSILLSCVICLTKSVILRLRKVTEDYFYLLQMSMVLSIFLVQLGLVIWAYFDSAYKFDKQEIKKGVVEGKCIVDPGLPHYLLYIFLGLLSLISLVLTTLGRNITENYNEGKFLAFQTIAMHIVIFAFIPTAHVLEGPTLNAAWAVTIALVSYTVLAVLFIPKLYIIIYRPYKNQFIDDLISPTEEENNRR